LGDGVRGGVRGGVFEDDCLNELPHDRNLLLLLLLLLLSLLLFLASILGGWWTGTCIQEEVEERHSGNDE